MQSQFWKERIARYGHTGWSDHATYFYDQQLRLKAVESLVRERVRSRGIALDYGCGTGDFAGMLSGMFTRVIAADILPEILRVARRRNRSPRIAFREVGDSLFDERYDLILCITVLQHVVDDVDLEALFSGFSRSVRTGGVVLVLDSLSDAEQDLGYMKLRSRDHLTTSLASHGFTLLWESLFWHPVTAPTPLFLAYRRRFVVRLLNRLCACRVPLASWVLRSRAARSARGDNGLSSREAAPHLLLYAKD